jgi:hypothetical protein
MRPRPQTIAISLGLAFVLAGGSASAKQPAQDHGYRTDGVVPSDKNECVGVPTCVSTTLPATTVPALGRKTATFQCPPAQPNLWNWDSAMNEYISVKMTAVDQSSVTVEGTNALNQPGDFVVSLGCSTEPYMGNGFLVSKQLAPTAQLERRKTPRRPQREPKQGVAAGDLCSSVPDCQPQTQPTFSLGGWASTTKRYACQQPYPYAWTMTWTQTGRPSVSAIGAIFAVDPGEMDVLLTNWNPFATDDVTITVACSKQNSFGGDCGAVQSDPGCPQVSGSQHTYCSKGPVPVCFSVYEERCEPSNQLYQCTDYIILPWCQPCPG